MRPDHVIQALPTSRELAYQIPLHDDTFTTNFNSAEIVQLQLVRSDLWHSFYGSTALGTKDILDQKVRVESLTCSRHLFWVRLVLVRSLFWANLSAPPVRGRDSFNGYMARRPRCQWSRGIHYAQASYSWDQRTLGISRDEPPSSART